MLHPALRGVRDDERLAVLDGVLEEREHDALEARELLAHLHRDRAVLPLHHLEVAGAEEGVVPIKDGDRLRLLRTVELRDEGARALQLLDVPLPYVVCRPARRHRLLHHDQLLCCAAAVGRDRALKQFRLEHRHSFHRRHHGRGVVLRVAGAARACRGEAEVLHLSAARLPRHPVCWACRVQCTCEQFSSSTSRGEPGKRELDAEACDAVKALGTLSSTRRLARVAR